jgi:quercetin dioxygenase-like cupin family protein
VPESPLKFPFCISKLPSDFEPLWITAPNSTQLQEPSSSNRTPYHQYPMQSSKMADIDALSAPAGPNLPPLKRYITSHDPDTGKAIYSTAYQETVAPDVIPGMSFYNTFTTSSIPANLSADQDLTAYSQHYPKMSTLHLDTGSVLRVCDFAPGLPPFMHRTVSLDYGILLAGTLECVLDSGETRTLHPGDIIVQRGTMHGWRNPSGTEWARCAFVLLPVEPLVVKGETLGDHVPWADVYAEAGTEEPNQERGSGA